MAIENFNEDVEVIQKLDTLPNQEGGLSAEELKAKFDQAAIAIKNFINNSLLPVVRELEDAKDPSIIYGLDQTLSELGRAADAKAVGDALAGKVGTKDIIGIACGGTGADNAAAARRNLDAAQAEHTHSASDMKTGLLPLDRGGTGAGTAAQAMENLGITAALAGKAPVALGAPHNYLDNSDFRNPVNQRGQTSYTGNGYSIDRWQLSNGTLTVNPDNITLDSPKYACDFDQNVENFSRLQGKVCTIAVKTSDGVFAKSFDMGNCTGGLSLISDKIMVYSIPDRHVILRVLVGVSVSFEWAGLYEGEYTAETLPEYKPKGYGAELAECQRYFLQYNFSDAILPAKMYSGGGSADVSFFLPCTMRLTKPTVSVTASHCQLFADNSNTDCNITEAYSSTGNFVGLTAVAESNLTGSAVAVCRIMGKLTLSADL